MTNEQKPQLMGPLGDLSQITLTENMMIDEIVVGAGTARTAEGNDVDMVVMTVVTYDDEVFQGYFHADEIGRVTDMFLQAQEAVRMHRELQTSVVHGVVIEEGDTDGDEETG